MDKRTFQRLIDGIDMFLIVDDVSLCKVDNIVIELEGEFPLSFHNKLITANISGTLTTYELDTRTYNKNMCSMLVVDKKHTVSDYSILIFRVVISDIDNNEINELKGNTKYSYTAKSMRILNIGGE